MKIAELNQKRLKKMTGGKNSPRNFKNMNLKINLEFKKHMILQNKLKINHQLLSKASSTTSGNKDVRITNKMTLRDQLNSFGEITAQWI